MKKVYLDNASTTAIAPEVITEITDLLKLEYGNPSSTHWLGRKTKNLIELSRKNIAQHLQVTAAEIIFTSGATEANNWILNSCVRDLKVTQVITSKIEHSAVLQTLLRLQIHYNFTITYVDILPDGSINYKHLELLLNNTHKKLVSLMHVNNETGAILNINHVATICKNNNTLFHTDAVQSVGKIAINLQQIPIDFLVASAHKFHGPKGIGFAFIKKNTLLQPIITGGEQEKGLRAGTENTPYIVGMAKALDLSINQLDKHYAQVLNLKNYLIKQAQKKFVDIKFVGNTSSTIANIINIILPFTQDKISMLLFQLDMHGIAVSRGSACQSGSNKPSHVLEAFLLEEDLKKPNIRVSLSHYNTTDDIDYLIETLKKLE